MPCVLISTISDGFLRYVVEANALALMHLVAISVPKCIIDRHYDSDEEMNASC